jgi:hypothetical protein
MKPQMNADERGFDLRSSAFICGSIFFTKHESQQRGSPQPAVAGPVRDTAAVERRDQGGPAPDAGADCSGAAGQAEAGRSGGAADKPGFECLGAEQAAGDAREDLRYVAGAEWVRVAAECGCELPAVVDELPDEDEDAAEAVGFGGRSRRRTCGLQEHGGGVRVRELIPWSRSPCSVSSRRAQLADLALRQVVVDLSQ